MIPPDLIKELEQDPFYEKCVMTGHRSVQWHHCFTFEGKSIQEKWAIVPLIKHVHDQCTQHKPEYDREVAEQVELIALNRATPEELLKYSKVVDLIAKRNNLRKKYESNNS